jgi:tetratricopeptide (TPR) repeat protein
VLGPIRRLFVAARKRPARALLVLLLLAPIGVAAFIVHTHFRAESLFADAEEALKRGDFARASVALDAYLEARPSSPEGHFLAARTARRTRSYKKALVHLRKAEQLGWSADALAFERLMVRAQQGDLSEIEEELQRVADLDQPEGALALEALTLGYMATVRLGRGLDSVERLLKRNPDHLEAQLWKGWLLVQTKMWQAAVDTYRRALALGAGDEARAPLAGVLMVTRQYAEAAELYQRLRLSRPDDVDVLLPLAEALRNLSQADEARRLLEAVLAQGEALKPTQRAFALAESAQLALAAGDAARAEPLLRESLALLPRQRAALFALAGCLETLGKAAEAASVRQQWQSIDVADKELVATLHALAGRPEDLDLRCRAGVLCLQLGNDADGLHWLNSVLALDRNHAGARKALEDYAKQPR